MSAARRLLMAALVAVAAVAAGGCADVSDRAQRRALAALTQTEPPPGEGLPELRPKRACLAHPYRSLPPSRLPRPGRMAPGSYMRTIQDRGELVVGVDQNTLKLGYYDPLKQRNEGFDIDLVREVARAIFGDPRKIAFIAISTSQREAAIVDEEVHLVASAFSVNCVRRRRLLFSTVYHRTPQRLLVPEDATVDGLVDLRGRTVCGTKTSTSVKRLRNTGVKVRQVPLRSDCLVLLQEGEVDAITSDDAILFGFKEQDPQTKIVGPCLNLERWGMAAHPDHPEFVGFVNGVLKRLQRSGRLAAIRRRWLRGLPVPTKAAVARCEPEATR